MHKKSYRIINTAFWGVFFSIFGTFTRAQTSYWQQTVNYKIDVTLDDANHFLHGNVSIEYINNSPDSLEYIYFHLYPNAYSTVKTAYAEADLLRGKTDFLFAPISKRGYLDSLSFAANGQTLGIEKDLMNPDIIKVILPKKLLSGNTIIISSPFRVKIPHTFSRLGHVKQSYQITQWYPKAAVYDKDGWHPLPYLDQGEFYSDFGCYDVNISLPQNYVVGATGVLRTESEKIFMNQKIKDYQQWLDKGKKNKQSKDELNPISDKNYKTINFYQCDVIDFAWFADKNFIVDRKTITLSNNQNVDCYALFNPRELNVDMPWDKGAEYVAMAIQHYSEMVGPYPYSHATAVLSALGAGGGMEYPMITVIGKTNSANMLETVIVHEVGHNWFQGIIATNERQYAWMDEGINSFYEGLYTNMYQKNENKIFGLAIPIGNSNTKAFYQNQILNEWQDRNNQNQALNLRADSFTTINYGIGIYMRTPLLLDYLRTYLGSATYDNIMHAYYNKFKFKHPQPSDLKYLFESMTHKELDWFFDEMITTDGHLDYAIHKVKLSDEHIASDAFHTITVRNVADISGPFSISAIKNDSILRTLWIGGFQGELELLFPAGDYDEYRIDALKVMPDRNRKNNNYKLKGIFHKIEAPNVRLLSGLQNPAKNTMNVLPIPAWNYHDKFMLGILMHNTHFPYNSNWQWEFMPMYSFHAKTLNGIGRLQYNIFPDFHFQKMYIGITCHKFSDFELQGLMKGYYTLKAYIGLDLKNKDARSRHKTNIQYTAHYVSNEEYTFDRNNNYVYDTTGAVIDTTYSYTVADTRKRAYLINELKLSIKNNSPLYPYEANVVIEQGPQYIKTNAEASIKINYPKQRKRGLHMRGYIGKIFESKTATNFNILENLHYINILGATGANDYKRDELYLGRTDVKDFWSHQILTSNGGFKSRLNNTFGYTTGNLLLSTNIKLDAPFPLPIGLFIDAAYLRHKHTFQLQDPIQYDIGIYADLFRKQLQIYLPFKWNDELALNIKAAQPKWYQRISFQFNIKKLNPIRIVREFDGGNI